MMNLKPLVTLSTHPFLINYFYIPLLHQVKILLNDLENTFIQLLI